MKGKQLGARKKIERRIGGRGKEEEMYRWRGESNNYISIFLFLRIQGAPGVPLM